MGPRSAWRSTANRWPASATSTPYHQFTRQRPGARRQRTLLPEISAEPRGEPGAADKRVQAYNFRIIATDDRGESRALAEAGELRRRSATNCWRATWMPFVKKHGRAPVFNELTLIARIPNGKADFNNNGAFSTDYIGKNYDYPDGRLRRAAREIWQDHVDYVQGFYYFLANDPRVPKPLQEEVRTWGLPKDEYADTGHWPHQLYVREARRMVGEFVAIQKDLQTERTKPDVIGMGSYNSDSHNVQRFVNAEGIRGERRRHAGGGAALPDPVPRDAAESGGGGEPAGAGLLLGHPRGLLSLRMEPQYMIIGHAAGVAASLALQAKVAVQKVDVAAAAGHAEERGRGIRVCAQPADAIAGASFAASTRRRRRCGSTGSRAG